MASAYYKGDEKNPQLQRVYGTAFKTKKELDDYFAMLEEAKKRDHRKLGKELEIYVIDDDVGPGLPMWLPRGGAIIDELEKLARETEFAAGYQRVRTPHIAREILYKKSGHLPYYADSMFPPMELHEGAQASSSWGATGLLAWSIRAGETPASPTDKMSVPQRYYLKAMNCPHHHNCLRRFHAVIAICRCGSRSTGRVIATSRAASCSASCGSARYR